MRAQAMAARATARRSPRIALPVQPQAGRGGISLDDLLWATCYQVASLLDLRVVLLLPLTGGDTLAVRAGYPPEDQLEAADLAAASWAWRHDRAAGRGSDSLPGCAPPVPAAADRRAVRWR